MSKIVGIVQVKGGAGRSTVSTNLAATVDSVTADLYADRAEAKKVNQFSASIAALMHIAKLHGLITDKGQHNKTLEEKRVHAYKVLESAGIDPHMIQPKVHWSAWFFCHNNCEGLQVSLKRLAAQ